MKPDGVMAMPTTGLFSSSRRDAHRARERAAQEAREVAVAVVGQAAVEAVRFVGHRDAPSVTGWLALLRIFHAEQVLEDAHHAALVLLAVPAQQRRLVGRRRGREHRHGDAVIGAELGAADQVLVGVRHRVAVAEVAPEDARDEELGRVATARCRC